MINATLDVHDRIHTLLIVKNKLSSFANCSEVIVSRPVCSSRTPPVAVWYLWKASVARRTRAVPMMSNQRNSFCHLHRYAPVSTMPAVRSRIGVPNSPYVVAWSIPQYTLAGEVLVMGLCKSNV
jgi:hypothetical protein